MMSISLYFLSFLFLFLFGFIFMLFSLYFMMYDYSLFLDWEFLSVNSSYMTMTFLFDWMSLMFSSCVFFISSMVVFYSYSYMSSDINSRRFLVLVLLFVFSMFMMIISPNLISILIGWDGLGLVSYCLVIYFQNYKSYNAGMLTILTNRIGDVMILLSIAWMLNFGSWHYIYYTCIWDEWMLLFLLFLVLAGFTKSAQIPFSSWLPAAMAAPTPVSALVHSSTLVTAGVYLLIRFSSFFTNFNCYFFVLIGLLTMFMAGLGANFEFDLKKIIALSTLSQLGLMMSILFLGFPMLAFFHLLTHAFFKALLFLCAGLIIHVMSDSQDIRHMGCVVNCLPFTCSCFCISTFSLCGFPFLSGFYSKDLIMELYMMSGDNIWFLVIFLVSIGFTASYSFRLIYYCLNGSNIYVCQYYFEDKIMISSMIFLTFMAIIFGSCLYWLMFFTPILVVLPLMLKVSPLIFVILGSWLGWEFSRFYFFLMPFSLSNLNLSYFLGSMWFMPKFSTIFMYSNSFVVSNFFIKNLDMGWGEYCVSNLFLYISLFYSKFLILYSNVNMKLFMLSFFVIIFFMIV